MIYKFDGQTFHGSPKQIEELFMNDENIIDFHLSKAFLVEDDRDCSIEVQAVLKDEYVENMIKNLKSKTGIPFKGKLTSGATFSGQSLLTEITKEPTGIVDSKYISATFAVISGELSGVPEVEIPPNELVDKIKKNALGLSLAASNSLDVNPDHMKGINIAIKKIFEGTGITIESLIEEDKANDWFSGK